MKLSVYQIMMIIVVVLTVLILIAALLVICLRSTTTSVAPGAPTAKMITWADVQAAPAFIINIERCKARLPVCIDRVTQAGYTDVRALQGVDGKVADLPAEFEKHGMCDSARFTPKFSSRAGEQGCFLSHLKALQRGLASGAPVFSVFEDDVVFAKDFASVAKQWYDETPTDYDMVYMGGYMTRPTFTIGNQRILRCPVLCTHALLYTREGAEKVYRMLTNAPQYKAIDEMLNCPDRIQHYVWNKKWNNQERNHVLALSKKMFESEQTNKNLVGRIHQWLGTKLMVGLALQDDNMPTTIQGRQ